MPQVVNTKPDLPAFCDNCLQSVMDDIGLESCIKCGRDVCRSCVAERNHDGCATCVDCMEEDHGDTV